MATAEIYFDLRKSMSLKAEDAYTLAKYYAEKGRSVRVSRR